MEGMTLSASDISRHLRILLPGLLMGVACLFLPVRLQAADAPPGIEVVSLHAQRYQDFANNRIACEMFGEIKNISSRTLEGITLTLDYLDAGGKTVASEDISLELRVIALRKSRGEARPVKPQEYGIFVQDTLKCPKEWLEGRIRYRIESIQWK